MSTSPLAGLPMKTILEEEEKIQKAKIEQGFDNIKKVTDAVKKAKRDSEAEALRIVGENAHKNLEIIANRVLTNPQAVRRITGTEEEQREFQFNRLKEIERCGFRPNSYKAKSGPKKRISYKGMKSKTKVKAEQK